MLDDPSDQERRLDYLYQKEKSKAGEMAEGVTEELHT